jgi:hypothetical protein
MDHQAVKITSMKHLRTELIAARATKLIVVPKSPQNLAFFPWEHANFMGVNGIERELMVI